MKALILVLALLAIAAPLAAQTIVSSKQEIFAAGVSTLTGSPVQTNVFLAAGTVCNQTAPVVPALVVNPQRFLYDDPANAGKVCIQTMTSAQLAAIPNGAGYLATLSVTDDLGQTSARSAASNPFSQQGAPAAPTGYKAVR